MIYYNDQSYMKSLEKTSVPKRPKYIEIKHYILLDEVQKRKVVLQYISTDEQISRYLGKASVQDERVCVLKKQAGAREDDFLIEKGKDDSQVGREH
jgi:hypothetical protein